MNKNFLVTVSNDSLNLTGVEFLCSFFKKLSEHQLTLLHICRLDATDMSKSMNEMWKKPEERITGHITIGAKKALERASKLLTNSNMSFDKMITKTFAERYGKIRDILNEGSSGHYDAIVLGKRASYTLQWFFERAADETAKEIIQDSSLKTPIWICPAQEAERKNVLVCVDGSEGALRAVDHVGYILSLQNQHSVTLFHVENGSGQESTEIFRQATKSLHEHAITDNRISTKTTWGLNIASTVTSFAEKEGFAAIAVGLQGRDKRILKRVNLAGGTAVGLIERAEKIALWCCP